MKFKKIVSLMLTAIMIAALCAAAVPAAAAAGNPVELMYARGDVYGGGGFTSFAAIHGYVEVQNIAYAKNVTIHYSFDETTWKDTSASYYKPTANNKEAWSFGIQDTQYGSSDTCTFAIKYEVAGKTYWDNNNGQNYKLKISGWFLGENYAIGNAGLKVESGTNYAPFVSSEGVFSGPVILKNLGNPKNVKVRYTTDNWSSFTEISASLDSAFNNGLERWTFSTTLPANWSTLAYAVSYTVNGITYWDNNFGANYTITKA